MIASIYSPNISILNFNFLEQTLLDIKAQLEPKTVIVRDLKTTFSSKDKSSRSKKFLKYN
jgi:hypothetical protein